ncbi:hypothetical protein CBR_g31446 [Chara braunii]|uniref:3-deoxy-manno-octulosonate cytidylyltransferase n=1 Tax=Chara braunii TaxID=69332 RepID=A0A388LEZ7_CHABU|nr:hypothetical protein CBR_g31446 [Chara braunii]|eukprot:GBG80890.1 hypothetical protein CBR_g31446 [Chara braunii]
MAGGAQRCGEGGEGGNVLTDWTGGQAATATLILAWALTVGAMGAALALLSYYWCYPRKLLLLSLLFSPRSKKRNRVIGIIPARYMSTRFEGKPLAMILGKPMIQRTYEQAKRAKCLDDLVVATDDSRIALCCKAFGADVVLTSSNCANGTERCNEALKKLHKRYDIVVNIQGDEPLMEPEIIDGVVKALQNAPDAIYSTAVSPLQPKDAHDRNRVKCIVDRNGYAIYFSRALIPHSKTGTASCTFPYLLHLGLQCYDADFLDVYCQLKPTPLQMEEDLEQLKVVENGYKIKVITVHHDAHGVDSPGDVASIEEIMHRKGIS